MLRADRKPERTPVFGPERRRLLRGLLKASREQRLFECRGRVHDPRSFAVLRPHVLSGLETRFLRRHLSLLPGGKATFPEEPLCLATVPPAGAVACHAAFTHVGARSVFFSRRKVFIKACRPQGGQGISFPHLDVDSATGAFQMSELPFGVLTRDGAMRELLAYVFACRQGFLTPRVPLAIIEYQAPMAGYAVVFHDSGMTRAEDLLDYPRLDLSDLLAAAICDRTAGTGLSPGEIGLRGVDRRWYVEQKARRLVEWHMAGGFRRFLNSNIGNDIIVGRRPASMDVAFVDFDSFCLRPPPRPSCPARCFRFMLRGALEAVRGSLPIASLVYDERYLKKLSSSAYSSLVLRAYEAASSGWTAYQTQLSQALREEGWPDKLVEKGWSHVKATPAFRSAVMDQLVDMHTLLRSYAPQESLYVPHGIA